MLMTIPLKWNPSDKGKVAGYKVRWGKRGSKPRVVAVAAPATTLTLAIEVPAKAVVEITVSAYDVAGNESPAALLTSVYRG